MEKKFWQEYSLILKKLFKLEFSPVAVSCLDRQLLPQGEKKERVCRSILDAGKGKVIQIDRKNNACFGASLHLGFRRIKDTKASEVLKKIVVEWEKLFCSYEALDNLMAQMEEVPDNSANYFLLSPMERAEVVPELVIFIVNAEGACRLLTFATFFEGGMPKIKIGGPTCRLSIIYPLVTGEVNLSFYDYTARKLSGIEKDKLIVSIPYNQVPKIIANIDKCSAGKAKIEFPPEFRAFLQKRLTPNPAP